MGEFAGETKLTEFGGTGRVADSLFSPIRDELNDVEEEFSRRLDSNVPMIAEIGQYLHGSRGKRIRPALLILSSKLLSGRAGADVVRMAAVVELTHTASLLHDDIVDHAEIRRGHQSTNVKWGNQLAALMGDRIYFMAAERVVLERNFRILDIFIRVAREMTQGELIELNHTGNLAMNRQQYLEILQRKTASLFSACTEIGAILGGATDAEQDALRWYGINLGMAFQLIDDVLDFTSNEDVLGKSVGSDLREG